jgi:hypothetical protein
MIPGRGDEKTPPQHRNHQPSFHNNNIRRKTSSLYVFSSFGNPTKRLTRQLARHQNEVTATATAEETFLGLQKLPSCVPRSETFRAK